MTNFARPYKIVVIDDDKEMLDLIKLNLTSVSENDIEVTIFENPQEALNYIQHHPIHIVITDLYMDQQSGMDVLEKCLELQKGLQIIAISADYSTESALSCYNRGAKFILNKPFKKMELVKAIADCINFLNYWNELIECRKKNEANLKVS